MTWLLIATGFSGAFTFLFMTFPSGLVLYWTVNNLLSMAQQWVVNRQIAVAKK